MYVGVMCVPVGQNLWKWGRPRGDENRLSERGLSRCKQYVHEGAAAIGEAMKAVMVVMPLLTTIIVIVQLMMLMLMMMLMVVPLVVVVVR